jgi:hypothetical protein
MAKCFVIMPISTPKQSIEIYKDQEHFGHVLQYLFKPALEKAGYEVIPPTAAAADIIHASIVKNLEEADLVLCDISTLNPNVFFELGIRTSLDRPVALVRDNFTKSIPFDTSSISAHTYGASLTLWSIESEVQKLADYIAEATARANGRNSMWQVFGITQRAEPAEIEDPTEAKLDLLMAQVGQLVKQAENHQSYTYTTSLESDLPVGYGGGAASTFPWVPTTNYGLPGAHYSSYGLPVGTTEVDSTGRPLVNPVPSKFDNFIQRAKAIALTESATINASGYDSIEDAVVISTGGWRLSEGNIKKIDHLAGSLKVRFQLREQPL